MVEYLIERKVKLQVKSVIGYGPLATIVIRNDLEILALLLSAVEDADEAWYSGMSAVYLAATYSHDRALQMLLRSDKLDPNRTCLGSAGDTALARTCVNGNLRCAELLCNDKRTNINFMGGNGVPAIQNAIVYGHWDAALCLIRSGRLQQGL